MADFDYTDQGHGRTRRLDDLGDHYADRIVAGGRVVAAMPDALPATSTSAYAAGDVLGGKMVLSNALRTNAGSGYLQDLSVTLKTAGLTAALDVILFRADPSASTFTDNAVFSVAAADIDKVVGCISLTKITALGNGTIYEANQLARSLKTAAGKALWAVAVWRGAPTLGSVADLAAVRANIAVD